MNVLSFVNGIALYCSMRCVIVPFNYYDDDGSRREKNLWEKFVIP